MSCYLTLILCVRVSKKLNQKTAWTMCMYVHKLMMTLLTRLWWPSNNNKKKTSTKKQTHKHISCFLLFLHYFTLEVTNDFGISNLTHFIHVIRSSRTIMVKMRNKFVENEKLHPKWIFLFLFPKTNQKESLLVTLMETSTTKKKEKPNFPLYKMNFFLHFFVKWFTFLRDAENFFRNKKINCNSIHLIRTFLVYL